MADLFTGVKIVLIGDLHPELISIGLKPGKFLNGLLYKTSKSVDFEHSHNGKMFNCSVWPVNYQIIEEDEPLPPGERIPLNIVLNRHDALFILSVFSGAKLFLPYFNESNKGIDMIVKQLRDALPESAVNLDPALALVASMSLPGASQSVISSIIEFFAPIAEKIDNELMKMDGFVNDLTQNP